MARPQGYPDVVVLVGDTPYNLAGKALLWHEGWVERFVMAGIYLESQGKDSKTYLIRKGTKKIIEMEIGGEEK